MLRENPTIDADTIEAALLERAPGFIAITAGPDHVFTFANCAYRRLIGNRDPVGRTVAEVLPEIQDQSFIALLDEVYRSGRPFVGHGLPITLATGQSGAENLHFIDFVYEPVRAPDGSVSGLFCQGQDVSDRKRSESHIEELERELGRICRLTAMSTMAESLAHELNQPLTALMAFAGAARRMVGSEEPRPGALAETLESIDVAARSASEIIRGFRTLARRREPLKETFDLRPALAEAAALAVAGRSSALWPALELPDGLHASGDRVQIQQVTINLLRNAFEAAPAGAAANVTLTAREQDGGVELRVCDDGPGVPAALLPFLFEPYHSAKPEGTGIGLWISRTIVEAHGGRMWYEPAPSGGACFCLTLPSAAAQAVALGGQAGEVSR